MVLIRACESNTGLRGNSLVEARPNALPKGPKDP